MSVPILFVDDEVNILRSLQRLFFDEEDYEVHTAESGAEALDMLEKEGLRPAVIVSDQRMPGMSGSEFLSEVRRRLPEAMRIILTGYADINAAVEAINVGAVYRYIMKPWDDDELKLAIRDAVAHYLLVQENRQLTEQLQHTNRQLEELNERLEQKVAERTTELRKAYEANLRLTGELEDKVRELEGWDRLHKHILTIHTVEETLDLLADVICRVVCCEGISIFLQEGEELELAASRFPETVRQLPDDEQLAAIRRQVFQDMSPRLLVDDELPAALRGEVQSVAVIPMGRGEKMVGVVEVVTVHRRLTGEETAKLQALATQGAIAVLDARMDDLLPELESSLDRILEDFDNEP